MTRRILYPGILLLLFVLLWELIVWYVQIPRYILPAPSQIVKALTSQQPLLIHHTLVTLKEIIAGFLLAFGVGVTLAFLMFHFPILEQTFYPIVIGSQTIPVFAIAPLLVLWLGYGLPSKVVMAALIVFFPIVVNTLDGLKRADSDAVNLLRILEASQWQILWKVRVPSALPFVFSGCKIGVSVSTIGAIIGEWVGSKEGLGYLMLHANAQLQVSLIFASLTYLTILGVGLFYLVVLIERWSMPWRKFSEVR
ncbi:MAG: ABC transporter permease subunit [Proteobacteria bacterium]|nr:ABC transporter permease subunit [Pseudomonadota bacterium]NIS67781.1 ABC transporter permease subunit [Pseudomonadota bacterium]